MLGKIFLTLVFVVSTSILLACTTPTPTPAPTVTPTPTASPTPTVTRTLVPSPTSTPVSYDGRWDGGANDGLLSGEVMFQVENNKVTEIAFNYTLHDSGCTEITSIDESVEQATTSGNNFSATIVGDGGKTLTLRGAFTSATEASGTLEYKGTLEGCPDFDRTVNWTAQNVPIPPSPTPTATPAKTAEFARRDGDITILSNGDVQFVETWEVKFTGGPFHSAHRTWLFGGYDSIGDWSVEENGTAYRQDTSQAPGTFTVTQSNAQNTLTWYYNNSTDGVRTFTLKYTVHGATRSDRTGTSFAWKFVEADRSAVIDSSHVKIHLPASAPQDQITATSTHNDVPAQNGVVLDDHTVEFDEGSIPANDDWALYLHFPNSPTPTGVPSGYDGEWEGTSSEGDPVSFLVQKNQITFVFLIYSYRAGSCSGRDGAGVIVKNTAVKGDSFTATLTDSKGAVYTLLGKFSSPTQAAGTFEVKGTECGNVSVDSKDTWTAVNASIVGTPTPPSATATPTPGGVPNDPKGVVIDFFFGLDRNIVDVAVKGLIDDNVSYALGPIAGAGKANLESYLQDQVNQGVQYNLLDDNITAAGNVAKFQLQVTGGNQPTIYHNCTATVVNGKITVLTFQ